MVLIKHCETYEKDTVLEVVRQIFATSGMLDGIAGLTVAVKPNLVSKKNNRNILVFEKFPSSGRSSR